MRSDQEIAEITIEPEARQIVKIEFLDTSLRFKCKRCAVFCCKLGGPKLSAQDTKRLERSGHNKETFIDSEQRSLRSKNDGSCVFLNFKDEEGLYQCSVYDDRPTLCMVYPFHFEKVRLRSYKLGFIGCCNGLNSDDGQVVNEQFFAESLQTSLFELIDSGLL